jgi:hypothetical protein
MPVVPEAKRVGTLRKWGISEPLIRLSCGEELNELFNDSCQGPPWYVYRGSVAPPRGPALAVLWEWCESVTGVWRRKAGLEFIKFGFGWPEEYEVLARTEQGFWATQFDFLYECDASLQELQQAAAVVGFRFLNEWLADRESAAGHLGTFEEHRAWRTQLVARIDQQVLSEG